MQSRLRKFGPRGPHLWHHHPFRIRPAFRFRIDLGFVCFLFAVLLTTSAVGQAPDDPDELLQRRNSERYLKLLLRQPRPGTAFDRVYAFHVDRGSVASFVESLKSDASDDGAHQMILGLVELRRGRDNAAVDAFQTATEQRPTDPLAPWFLGQTLIDLGETERGAAALEESLARKPAKADAADIFELLGRTLQRAGKTDAALDVWKRFETAFPGDERVQQQIAAALAAEGQLDDARARYERLAESSNDPYRRVQFGIQAAELQMKSGDQKTAIRTLESLLENVKPDSWMFNDIRRRLEDTFLESDDTAGLIGYYRAWLKDHESDVDAMSRLAKYLSWNDQTDEAREWFERVIELAPSNAKLRSSYIDMLIAEQDFTAAAQQAEALATLQPDNVDAIERWGSLTLKRTDLSPPERTTRAAEIWKSLLEDNGDDVGTVARVADLLRSIGQQDDAISLYRKTIQLAPNDLQYREYLGEYFHSLNRHDEAIATWDEIATGERRTTENLVRQSEIFRRFQHPDRALRALTAACEIDPEFSDRLRLARMLQDFGKTDAALEQLKLAAETASSDDERETVLRSEIRILQDADLLADRAAALARRLEANGAEATAADWRTLAMYQRELGQLRNAATAAQKAVNLAPDSLPALTLLADLADDAGLMTNALDAYTRLAEADFRSRTENLRKVAELHRRLGEPDAAIEAAERLVEHAPENPDHYRFLADLNFSLGRSDEGLDALRRAVRVNSTDVEALKTLAESLATRFQTPEAIELYWRAFHQADGIDAKTTIIQTLTDLYLRTNHFDRLVARLQRASRSASDRRDAVLCLATAYEASGDPGSALDALNDLLAENSRDVLLLAEMSRLAELTNDFQRAAEYQKRINELRPSGEGTVRLVDLIARTGSDQQTDALLSQFSTTNLDSTLLLKSIDQLIAQEKYAIAEQLCGKLKTAQTADWQVQFRLVILAALQGHHDDVDARCDALLDLNPTSVVTQTASPTASDVDSATESKPSERLPQVTVINRTVAGIVQWIERRHSAGRQNASAPVASGSFQSLSAQQQQSLIQKMYFSQRVGVASPTAGVSSSRLSEVTSFRSARAVAIGLSMANAERKKAAVPRLLHFADRWRSAATNDQGDASQRRAMWDWYFAAISTSQQRPAVTAELLNALNVPNDAEPHFARLLYVGSLKASENAFPIEEPLFESLLNSWNTVAREHPDWLLQMQDVIPRLLAGQFVTDRASRFLAVLMRPDATATELQLALPLSAEHSGLPTVHAVLDRLYPSAEEASAALRPADVETLGTDLKPAFLPTSVTTASKDDWALRRSLFARLFARFLQLKARAWRPSRASSATIAASSTTAMRDADQSLRLPCDQYWSDADVAFFAVVRKAFAVRSTTDVFDVLDEFRRNANGHTAVMAEMAMAEFFNLANDENAATVSLIRASELAPDDTALRLAVAWRLRKSGNDQEALAVLDTITATDQSVLKERETLALSIAQQRGLLDRAKVAAERLFGIRLSPKESMALVSQLNQLGLKDKAQAVLSRVRKTKDTSLDTLLELLKHYISADNTPLANEVAHRILRVTSGSSARRSSGQVAGARTAVMKYLAESGELEKMIARTREQISRAPGSVELHRQILEYYLAAGMRAEAALTSQTIRRLTPPTDQLSELIANARRAAQRNQTAEAQALFLQVMDRDPQHFANNYYEYLTAFGERDGVDKLSDRVLQMNLKKLRNGSQIAAELIQRLGRSRDNTNQKTEKAVALLRKAWDAFPAYRATLISSISAQSIWDTPTMFEFAKDVVLPNTVQQAIARPWAGLTESRQLDSGGRLTGLITRLDAHLTDDKLSQFTAEVAERTERFKDWTGGQLLLAVLKAKVGDHVTAENLLRQFGEETLVPVNTAWVLASELPRIDPRYTPTCADILYRSVMTFWDQANGVGQQPSSYEMSPRFLAVSLLVAADRPADAVRLAERAVNDFPDTLSGSQLALSKMSRFRSVATHLAQLGLRIPAIRYFESVTHELAAQGRSAHGNRVAPDHRVVEDSQRAAAQLRKAVTAQDLNFWLDLELDRIRDGSQAPPVDLLLRPARTGMKEKAVSGILIDVVRQIPVGNAPAGQRLPLSLKFQQRLEALPSGESSVAVLSLLWSSRVGDSQLQAAAFDLLQSHLQYVADQDIPPQRSEIALWIAAEEAMKTAERRSLADDLAKRAELAAQITDAEGWYLPILRWRGDLAIAAGDKAAAADAWSELLNAVLADGISTSGERPNASVDGAANPADSSSRRVNGSVLEEVRSRLLNPSTRQAP